MFCTIQFSSQAMENLSIKDIRPGLKNINVVFIVLEVGVATLTKENREVRTFKVADQSACINVSVWDEPGKLLVPGDIVRLTKGYAVIWRQCLTLYSGKNGDISKIGDFCLLFNEQVNMSEPNPNFAQTPLSQQQQPQSHPAINNNNSMNNGGSGNGINGGGLPVSNVNSNPSWGELSKGGSNNSSNNNQNISSPNSPINSPSSASPAPTTGGRLSSENKSRSSGRGRSGNNRGNVK